MDTNEWAYHWEGVSDKIPALHITTNHSALFTWQAFESTFIEQSSTNVLNSFTRKIKLKSKVSK